MIYQTVAAYVAIAWLVVMLPVTVSQLLRCVVHDRRYNASLADIMTGASVVAVLAFGVPNLGGLV